VPVPAEPLQERTDPPEPSPASPPARAEPSRRLCANSKYGNLPTRRAPKHIGAQALRCTRHPTRAALESESRAGPIGEWRMSTSYHDSDRTVVRVSRSPSSTIETLREPPMSPPRTPRAPTRLRSAPPERPMSPPSNEKRSTKPRCRPASSTPDSGDPAPRRLVSYQLDTPTPPSVSLWKRRLFSGEVHEPPSCRERVPDLVGLGWTSLPDVAAKEWSPPIRLPRKPQLPRDDLESWTIPPKRCRRPDHTHDW
jgi:hypothetical protein